MKAFRYIPLLLSITGMLAGCHSMRLEGDAMHQALERMRTAGPRTITFTGELGERHTYLGNNMRYITLPRRDSTQDTIPIDMGTGMHVRTRAGKDLYGFWDASRVEDSTLLLSRARIFFTIRSAVPLDSIRWIEIIEGTGAGGD